MPIPRPPSQRDKENQSGIPRPPSQSDTQKTSKRKGGIFSRIAERFKTTISSRAKRLSDIADVSGREQSLAESAIQTAGTAIGGLGELGFEAIAEITPEKWKEKLTETLGLAAPVIEPIVQKMDEIKESNPRLYRNLTAAFEIGEVIPAVKGSKVASKVARVGREAVEEAIPVVRKGISEVTEKGAEILDRKILDDTLDVVRPVLSKKEKESALKTGRGKTTGLLRKFELEPSKNDFRVAERVSGIVKKGNTPDKNIGLVKNEITKSFKEVSGYFEENPGAIFNTNRLTSKLSKTKENSRILFGSDNTLEKAYDSVTDEMVKLVKEEGMTPEGLWKARQKFDDIIEDKLPKVFDNSPGDNLRKNAALDVRRATNEFIADLLPEGNPFKDKLAEMTDMYHAVDNIAGNTVGRIDTNALQRVGQIIKNNPVLSAVGLAGLTTAGLTGVLTSPITIGTLVAYGSVKVGKKIITSKQVKEVLSKVLKKISDITKDNPMAPEAIHAKPIRDLIDSLD